jgi:L-amino acid N-acyltransferase YncA
MPIRLAIASDLPAIIDIYNAAIPTRIATADTEPITVESRQEWFAKHQGNRPMWVLEVDGAIAAWLGLTSFYGGRPAYNATAEVSIYIAPQYQRQGYGSALLQWAIDRCPDLGITTLLAMYFDHNVASQRLFTTFGFEPMGHLESIAVLDGIDRGLVIAGRRITGQQKVSQPH